jgi:uncharacterized protein (TIGR02611 family)|nr:putative transmembrane protein (PGPGW) [uncultured bacterium]
MPQFIYYATHINSILFCPAEPKAHVTIYRMKKVFAGVKKAAVAVAGFAVIILGIILVPLPGPGWLVVIGGLVILSTEFEWADRLKIKLRAKLSSIYKKAKSKTKPKKN